jgi:hypothetical protein
VKATKLRSWAAKDKNGNLNLYLVNNNAVAPCEVSVQVAGFPSGSEGKTWTMLPEGKTLDGDDEPILQRREISINGVIRPDPTTLPGDGKPLTVGNTFKVNMPACSMMMVRVPKGHRPGAGRLGRGREAQGLGGDQGATSGLDQAGRGRDRPAGLPGRRQGRLQPLEGRQGEFPRVQARTDQAPRQRGREDDHHQVRAEGRGMVRPLRPGRRRLEWPQYRQAKYINVRVYSEKPVSFGVTLEDEVKNTIKVELPMTEESVKWQTLKVQVYPSDQFRGTVKGFNLYMTSGARVCSASTRSAHELRATPKGTTENRLTTMDPKDPMAHDGRPSLVKAKAMWRDG